MSGKHSFTSTIYCAFDRFTVMSLDLQPDVSLDGVIDDADAAALAADWDRTWLICGRRDNRRNKRQPELDKLHGFCAQVVRDS